jgi:hypothetical protein
MAQSLYPAHEKAKKPRKWSDTFAESKLSAERRAHLQAEVEQELLEMNLQELGKAAGVTQADVA